MNFIRNQLRRGPIRVILTLLLLAVSLLLITQSVFAEDNIYTGTIPSSEVISNDIIIYGNDVVVNGTIEGDVFAAGRTVTVNGVVEGSLFVAGEKVTLNGDVGGSVYSAAVNIELGPEATIGRSLYFIAVRVSLAQGSFIEWDLVGFALGAELGSSPGRDQKVVFGLVELVLRILDRFDVETGNLALLPDPIDIVQSGSGRFGKLAFVGGNSGTSGQVISDGGAVVPAVYKEEQQEMTQGEKVGEWTVNRLNELVTFLVIVGLTAWWFPSAFTRWAFYLRARPLASAGFGIVAWASGFAGFGILLALIIAIGIGLIFATLGALAVAFWGVSLPSLILAFAIFLIFLLYLSKGIVAYVVGFLILERIAPKVAARKFWPILLGLIIYVLLRSIPYFGWAVSLVVTLMGLGAVWLTYTSSFRQPLYLDASSDEAE